jgi:hypothetical protein
MLEFGTFMAEKQRRPEGMEFGSALRRLEEISGDPKLKQYRRQYDLGILDQKGTMIARERMKKIENELTDEFKSFTRTPMPKYKPDSDESRPIDSSMPKYKPDSDESRPISSSEDPLAQYYTKTTQLSENKIPKIIKEQSESAGNMFPESTPKITKQGGFISKRDAKLIGAAGVFTAAGVTSASLLNEKPKSRQTPEQRIFPWLDTSPRSNTTQIPQQTPKQDTKQDQKSRQILLDIQGFGQGQESGQKQSQRFRYRTPQIPYSPQIPFLDQPLAPAYGYEYKEPPIEIPVIPFKPFLLRGGGGDAFGGFDTDEAMKYFRVYDVAKTPFQRVRVGLGFYEDSPVPNYEIQSFKEKPYALAAPKDITTEQIENLYGEPKKKRRKK